MSDSSFPYAPSTTRWEWAQAGILAANLSWTTLANGGIGGWVPVATLVLTTLLLGVHLLACGRPRESVRAIHPAGWLLVPFLVYALINVVIVTPVGWLGWRDWLSWAQLVVVFWVVLNGVGTRAPGRFVFFALVALGLIGVLMACYQRFVAPDWRMIGAGRGQQFSDRATGPFGAPNNFAGFLLLILPAVIALAMRRAASATERVWWGWVGLVLSLGLILTLSRGAWLAFVLVLPILPLVGAGGGGRRRASLAAAVLLVLLAVGYLIVTRYPPAQQRFRHLVADNGEVTRPVMWRGAWELFRDSPWVGTGAGSYNVLFERHRPEGFRDEPLWAHNEYLNTLSDYGIAGFVLLFGAAAVIAAQCVWRRPVARRRTSRLADPLVLAGFGTGLLAFALQMGLDFHWKIPALALGSATMAGLAVGAAWPATVRPQAAVPDRFRWYLFVALGVAGTAVWSFGPRLAAEGLRSEARREIDLLWQHQLADPEYRRVVLASHDTVLRATRIDPENAQAWADLAYATVLRIHLEPSRSLELGKSAEAAANHAIRVSEACGEFWVRRGLARDAQGRWEEAGNDFQKAVNLAPADSTTWFYLAEHLSRVWSVHEAAEAALEFCLRLDPGNGAGLALRQRLALMKKTP